MKFLNITITPKSILDKKTSTQRFVIFFIIILLILALLYLLVLRDGSRETSQEAAKSNPINSSATLDAVSFTQQVFYTYLKEWESGEQAFIKNHSSWFTKNFLKYSVENGNSQNANGTYLFCNTVLSKPERFIVTAGSISHDQNSVTVYLNAVPQGKTGVVNVPVLLIAKNNSWLIESANCELF